MTPEQLNIIPNPSFTMDDKGNLVPTQIMPVGAEVVTPGDNTKPMPASPYASGPNGGKVNEGAPEANTANVAGSEQQQAFKTPDYAQAPAAPKEATSPTPEVATSPTPAATPAPKVTTDPQPSVWTNGFSKDAVQQSGKSIADAYNDYNQWAKENGKDPLDFFDVWTMFNNKDLTKSVEENVVDEKKAKRKEDWERVGNFLSHLANFVGTTQGAPSQQLESGIELTKRQQALRDKTLAQRQSTARDMIAAYRQKKADEVANRRAKVEERKQDDRDKQTSIQQAKAEAYINYQNSMASKNKEQEAYWKTKAECLEKGMSLEEAKKKAETAAANARAAASTAEAEKTRHDDERAAAGKTETREVEKKDRKGTTTTKVTVTSKPATTKKKNPMASSGKKPNPMK